MNSGIITHYLKMSYKYRYSLKIRLKIIKIKIENYKNFLPIIIDN